MGCVISKLADLGPGAATGPASCFSKPNSSSGPITGTITNARLCDIGNGTRRYPTVNPDAPANSHTRSPTHELSKCPALPLFAATPEHARVPLQLLTIVGITPLKHAPRP